MSRAHTRTAPTIQLPTILAWVAFALVMLVTLFPVYWVLRTALSDHK